MKKIMIAVLTGCLFVACNSSEQSDTTGNSSNSTTVNADTMSDTRGEKGAGIDNTGGTPGPGTLTDSSHGKTDTLGQSSKK